LTLRTNEEEPADSARRVIEKLEELGYLEPAKEYGRRAS
jgi:Fic family protein